MKKVTLFTLVLAAALISSTLTLFLSKYVSGPQELVVREEPQTYLASYSDITPLTSGNVPRTGPDFVDAAGEAVDAVTFIRSIQVTKRSFWGGDEYGYSTGSGVLVSADGYILSNLHVIDHATEIHVTLNDLREYEARVVGKDKSTDLALLKIDETALPHLDFGNSDSVRIGEWVLAVGNPFKLQSTVTAGIVSAKARNIDLKDSHTSIESFIQTDAAVNSGNSGGALVNTSGELIGINTAIISYSGQYEGYSFAVPSNIVLKIFEDLRDYGAAQRGWMDISISSMNQERASSLDLQDIRGVYLDAVFEGGAASKAGLQPGDVILTVNNTEIMTIPDFMEQIAQRRPGDVVQMDVYRRGERTKIFAILTSREDNTSDQAVLFNEGILRGLGIEIRDLTDDESSSDTEIKSGISVVTVNDDSQAGWADMEAGFVITHLENERVHNVQDFLESLSGIQGNFLLQGQYPSRQGDWLYELSTRK